MKSSAFAYERPPTVDSALASKRRWGPAARFLAGGQSLVPALNMRLNQPECLIDLNAVAELRGIREEGGDIVIGAMARHAEVLGSELVRAGAPLLCQAGRHLAHAAIRNRGTFGGSVALADPAAEWPSACLLLEARMRIRRAERSLEVAASEFFQGLYTTALEEDDLLEAVVIPRQPADEKSCVLELSRRHGDYAMAAVMARAQVRAQRLSGLRLVFFAVADKPLRDPLLEATLQETANAGAHDRLEEAVRASLAGSSLRPDLYNAESTKLHLCGVLARRALQQLCKESP